MSVAERKIAVLYGGVSSEREVSLNTGKNCYEALLKLGYEAALIDVSHDVGRLLSDLQETRPDAAFNALHGRFGEDGNIQGLLNLLRLPYTHSGVCASALAMDKARAKLAFKQCGIPVADHQIVTLAETRETDVVPYPYVLKPNNEGSSSGVFLIKKREDVPPVWEFGEEAMAEAYIPGREFTVGVMADQALGLLEIVTDRVFYNYDAKYSQGGSAHIVPHDLLQEIEERMRDYAVRAHKILGCRGVTRSDFRYDAASGRLAILEINTQPGMTATSLIPDMARNAGVSYEDVVQYLVEEARCDT